MFSPRRCLDRGRTGKQRFDTWSMILPMNRWHLHSRTCAGLEKRGVGGPGVVAGSSSDLLAALFSSFSSSCKVIDVGLGAELNALVHSPL